MLQTNHLKDLLIAVILLAYAELMMADNTQQSLSLNISTIAVSPYGIEHTQGNSGIYYELADTLKSAKGVNRQHQILPYARILHELKKGQTDLTIMFKYQELEQYVTYISPLPSLKNIVIGIKGSRFDSLSGLEGKRIAYLRGAKFSDDIDNNPKVIVIPINDFQQGINLLAAKRADAIIGPIDPILAAAQALNKPQDFFGQSLLVSERTPWVQISNLSELMLQIGDLKQHFDQLISSGKLEQLRSKYLPYYQETYNQKSNYLPGYLPEQHLPD